MATQALSSAATGSTIINDWLVALEREGVSERNRLAHRTAVERLGEYLRPRGPEEASAAELRGFLSYLGQLGVSEQSRGVYQAILLKWLSFAASEREEAARVAKQAADALNAEQLRPIEVGQPVLMETADSEATAMIAIVDSAPVFVLPADELSEGQAESTWPVGKPRPFPHAPSNDGLAAKFDGVTESKPAAEPLTIDYAAPPDDEMIEVEVVMDDDDAPPAAFAPEPSFGGLVQPTQETPAFVPPPAPPVAPSAAPSWMDEAPMSASTSLEDAMLPHAFAMSPAPAPLVEETAASAFAPPPEAAPPPPAPAAFAAPPAFGTAAPSAEGAPPESMFGAPLMAFGPPVTEAPASVAGASADATPVRAMAAVPGMGVAPQSRAQRDASMKEQVMDAGLASIAVGRSVAKETKAKPKARAQTPPAELKAKAAGWSVRAGGAEKADLDLAQIRNMAASGEISPSTAIRKPGGEWMKAGEYAPLKSVFQQARSVPDRMAHDLAAEARGPLKHPTAFAWLGAVLGAFAGGAAWWLAAVVMGGEVLGASVVAGVFCGGVSLLVSRGETTTPALAAPVATLLAMIVGRSAVWKTMSVGLLGQADAKTDALTFVQSGLTGEALTWWAFGCGAALLVGLASLLTRRH